MHLSAKLQTCLVVTLASLIAFGAAATPQPDNTRRQIEALLGVHDTFVSPDQWKKLSPGAEQILETIATDPSVSPTQRARALEGISTLNPGGATVILRHFANSANEPSIMRMAAIRGLGRVLPAQQLLPQLRALLHNDPDIHVRGAAAEVLARDPAGAIEAQEQGKNESAGWRARFLQERTVPPASINPQPADPLPDTPAPARPNKSETEGAISPKVPHPSATSESIVDLTPGGPINIGTAQLTTLTMDVPAGTISFDLFGEAVSDTTARLVIYRISSPDGTLFNYTGSSNALRVQPSTTPDCFSALVPNTPALTFSPGTWTFKFLASKATTASIKAILKSGTAPSAGRFDLNLFFVNTGSVTASTAPTNPVFQTMLNGVRTTYAQAGIQIGQVNYLDITGSAAAQYGDLDTAQLADLVRLSATPGAQSNAVNVFFTHTITSGSLPGYVIAGISAGIPGLPSNGTTMSGLAVAMADFNSPGNGYIISAWAHEMAHWLGLFHTTESAGKIFDPLADTPQCDSSHDSNADGIVDSSECASFDANNLMFWTGTTNNALTANQAFVLLRNPVVYDQPAATPTPTPTPTATPTATPTVTPTPPPNTSPTIAPQGTARRQGTAAANSVIATVSDAESSAGSLTVTAISVPLGLTISNIVNTNGTVRADIAASCEYSTGNKAIVLQVSDGYLTATGNLNINVLPNSFPILTYNNPSSITLGSSTDVTPASASDNGSITDFSLVSQGTYTGTIFINPLTGVVSFSNAAPAGSHTITIRATDNCGLTKDASFTLPVFDSAALDSLDLQLQGAGYVRDTALQPDGKLIIAGGFDHVLGVVRNNIARLNADGTLDMGFDPNALTGDVNCVVVQPDGKILVGGIFTDLRPNGVFAQRQRLARLNSDGTVDPTFDPEANNGVNCMVLQPDGKILVGGSFTALQPNLGASVTRNRVARLNANGTVDTFDPNANTGSVLSLALQPDGKVVIGGSFTTLKPNGAASATTRNRIARVNADGTLDTGFNPNANNAVLCTALQPDGKVLIGGTYTTLQPNSTPSPTTRNRIARLNSDGTLDTGFNPNIGSTAGLSTDCLALQTDGKVLLSGSFTTLQPNGAASPTTRNRIARVNSDGTLDTGFNPNANAAVNSMSLQPDGKVLLGGQFSSLQPNGTATAIPRIGFARLFNDPATQSLTASTTTQILWSRGGAGPELTLASFDYSTDGGANWTSLGNASRVGTSSNWQLTGLSLPATGQLRARGRPTDGYLNGGSGLFEQITSYSAIVPATFDLTIAQKGTATYSPGADTTSITMTFKSSPNVSVNLQYATSVGSWISYGGNPVNTGPAGSFNVTFSASGNQAALWNSHMFFKAVAP